ncbi:Fic protein [Streptomyces sp. NBRC 110611]|nr:Fic protein [Streptomyces sp. NBRC 110611]
MVFPSATGASAGGRARCLKSGTCGVAAHRMRSLEFRTFPARDLEGVRGHTGEPAVRPVPRRPGPRLRPWVVSPSKKPAAAGPPAPTAPG